MVKSITQADEHSVQAIMESDMTIRTAIKHTLL